MLAQCMHLIKFCKNMGYAYYTNLRPAACCNAKVSHESVHVGDAVTEPYVYLSCERLGIAYENLWKLGVLLVGGRDAVSSVA